MFAQTILRSVPPARGRAAESILSFTHKVYSQNEARLDYGFQYNFNDVRIYLLPSTSGQSYADTKYDEKLDWFRELRRYSLRI